MPTGGPSCRRPSSPAVSSPVGTAKGCCSTTAKWTWPAVSPRRPPCASCTPCPRMAARCDELLRDDAEHVRDRPLAPVAVVLPEAGLITSGEIEIDAASMNRQARLGAALDVHRAGDVERKREQIRVEVAHRPRRA